MRMKANQLGACLVLQMRDDNVLDKGGQRGWKDVIEFWINFEGRESRIC